MIAIGFKKITTLNLSREELEKDITFGGFLTFVNPLKSDSAEIIQHLNQASIECKLITGDNIFTGIEAGFQTNIMERKLNSCLLDF
jgi:P-type E1-E2 ATPase